jgi:hypothetical protein
MDKKELKRLWYLSILIILSASSFNYFGYSDQKIENSLSGFYGLKPNQDVKIHEYESNSDLPKEFSFVPGYAAGVAFPERGEIFLFKSKLGSYPFGSLEQVYAHELSHVYLFRAVGQRVPRWFDEGVAMKVSGEWGGKDDFYLALALPQIAYRNFNLEKLEKDFGGGDEGAARRSYAISRAFVRDIFYSQGDMREFIFLIRSSGSFDKAFALYFKVPPEVLFERWAKRLPWWGPLFSILASSSSIWMFVVLLFLIASFIALRRRRWWKKKWAEEELAEREKPTIQ